MTELDAFEARFAEAYRSYLEEAPMGVDAAEVARVAVARRRHGWRLGRWAPKTTPAAAWLLLAALLLAAMVGAAVVGRALRPVPAGDLPAGLAGTWSSLATEPGSLSLALTADACSAGRTCGTLTIINPDRCDYELVLRSAAADAAVFEVGQGASFGCAYSGWPLSLRQVSLMDRNYVQVDAVDRQFMVIPYRRVFLYRIDLSQARVPERYAGTWDPATTGPGSLWLRLGRCAMGQPCGSLDVVVSSDEVCSYVLIPRSWTADGVVLDVGDLIYPDCTNAEWTGSTVRLSLVPADGRLSVSRDAIGGSQVIAILDPAD